MSYLPRQDKFCSNVITYSLPEHILSCVTGVWWLGARRRPILGQSGPGPAAAAGSAPRHPHRHAVGGPSATREYSMCMAEPQSLLYQQCAGGGLDGLRPCHCDSDKALPKRQGCRGGRLQITAPLSFRISMKMHLSTQGTAAESPVAALGNGAVLQPAAAPPLLSAPARNHSPASALHPTE